MERQPKETVDEALKDVETSTGRYAYSRGYAGVLTAEVRALRAENERLNEWVADNTRLRLMYAHLVEETLNVHEPHRNIHAKLFRLETLSAALVAAARAVVEVGFDSHECSHLEAVEALREALKPFEEKP
jgi:hypothetical protein